MTESERIRRELEMQTMLMMHQQAQQEAQFYQEHPECMSLANPAHPAHQVWRASKSIWWKMFHLPILCDDVYNLFDLGYVWWLLVLLAFIIGAIVVTAQRVTPQADRKLQEGQVNQESQVAPNTVLDEAQPAIEHGKIPEAAGYSRALEKYRAEVATLERLIGEKDAIAQESREAMNNAKDASGIKFSTRITNAKTTEDLDQIMKEARAKIGELEISYSERMRPIKQEIVAQEKRVDDSKKEMERLRPEVKSQEAEESSASEKGNKREAEHPPIAAGQRRLEYIARVREGLCAPDEAARVISGGGSDAVPDLVKLLHPNPLDEPNSKLQIFAIMALGNIGEAAKEAVPTLIDSLAQQELQLHALRALGKIGPPARSAISAMFLHCRDIPSALPILKAAFDRIDPEAGQVYRQLQLLQSKMETLKSRERLAKSRERTAEVMGKSPHEVGELAQEVAKVAMEEVPVIKGIERLTVALLRWKPNSEAKPSSLPIQDRPLADNPFGPEVTPKASQKVDARGDKKSLPKEVTVDLGKGVKLREMVVEKLKAAIEMNEG